MIDRRRIEDIIRNLDGYLVFLYELKGVSESNLVEDPLKLGAAKYYLQVSVECCIDLANHLIAQLGWRRPESMADAFVVLEVNRVIQPDFLPTLRRMAQFRNRLVHLYWEVDAPTIYRILQENIGDFERFESNILDYLASFTNTRDHI